MKRNASSLDNRTFPITPKSIYYFRSLVASLGKNLIKAISKNLNSSLSTKIELQTDGSWASEQQFVTRVFNLFHKLDFWVQENNLEIDNPMINELVEQCRKTIPKMETPSSIVRLTVNELRLFRILAGEQVITYGRSKAHIPKEVWITGEKSQSNALGALATPDTCIPLLVKAYDHLDKLCLRHNLIIAELESSEQTLLIDRVRSGIPIPLPNYR